MFYVMYLVKFRCFTKFKIEANSANYSSTEGREGGVTHPNYGPDNMHF